MDGKFFLQLFDNALADVTIRSNKIGKYSEVKGHSRSVLSKFTSYDRVDLGIAKSLVR